MKMALIRRILVFEGVYVVTVAILLLAMYIGIPSQGEGNLAAWAIVFASAPVVYLLGLAGVPMESMWSTFAGRFSLFGFYAIVVALLAVMFRGRLAGATSK